MAGIALALDLGVRRHDGTRHKQFLKRVVSACSTGQGCHGHDGRQQ